MSVWNHLWVSKLFFFFINFFIFVWTLTFNSRLMPSIWLLFADKLTFEVTNERIIIIETSKNRLIHRLDSFFRISDTQKFKTKHMKGLFLVWTAYEIDWSHLTKHVQFPSTSNTPNLTFFSVVFGNAISKTFEQQPYSWWLDPYYFIFY